MPLTEVKISVKYAFPEILPPDNVYESLTSVLPP